MNAPPRSSDAPAARAIRAAARVCSGVSTAHGPAITVSVSGPIGTPATRMTERSRRCSRLTSLYGTEIRTTSATPRQPGQVQGRGEPLDVAAQPDDRPRLAAADERLAARVAHHAHHMVHIGRGGVRGHHHNHLPSPLTSLTAGAASSPRAKFLQRSDIPRVPRLPAGRLDDEGDVGQRGEQLAERARCRSAPAPIASCLSRLDPQPSSESLACTSFTRAGPGAAASQLRRVRRAWPPPRRPR